MVLSIHRPLRAARAPAETEAKAAAEAMAAAHAAASPAGSVHSARSVPRAGPRLAVELLATSRRGGMMTRGEIDKVLRIQSLTACPPGGDPFVEDFYFREARLRHGGPGTPPNAPQKLREGVGKADSKRGATKHVDLAGLGRLALSNVRGPRALMDLRAPAEAAGEGGEEEGSLEGSAALQVRILLESCEGMLLDVDDVDRMLAARFGAPPPNGAGPGGGDLRGDAGGGSSWGAGEEESTWLREDLEARRGALLEGVCKELFLPPQAGGGVEAELIFLWIVSNRRGRKLLERFLWRLPPGHPGAAEATRRSCGDLGRQMLSRAESAAEQAGFVGALVRAVSEMPRALVGECLTGFCRGGTNQEGGKGRSEPLARLADPAPGAAAAGGAPFHEGSLAIATALLRRAGALGAAASGDTAVWAADVSSLCSALLDGLKVLGASGVPGAQLQRVLPLDLIRALLPQLSDAQRGDLRNALVSLQ